MKTKHIIIISVSVLVVLIIAFITLYWVGRRQGKRRATEGNKTKLPSETDWGASLTAVESANIERIASSLYEDMKGLNFFGHNHLIYEEYLATDDRTFIGVANYFADKYGGNLAQWIKDENYSWTSFATAGVTDSIIARLAKNNIVTK